MDKSYRELFFCEAEEYLSQINGHLVSLEKNSSDQDAINEIFRLMHTLKGMAATMGFNDLADFSHKIEDFFDSLRYGKQAMTGDIMDTVFACIDAFSTMVDELRAEKKSTINVKEYIKKINDIVINVAHDEEPAAHAAQTITQEPISLSLNELQQIDSMREEEDEVYEIYIRLSPECAMKEARMFLIMTRLKAMGRIFKTEPSEEEIKVGTSQEIFKAVFLTKENDKIVQEELLRVLEVERVVVKSIQETENISLDASGKNKTGVTKKKANYLKKIQSMRIPVVRLDKIMNLMGELSIAKSRLVQVTQAKDYGALEEIVFGMDRLVSFLQDEVLQMRLLPVSHVLDALPRVVRDVVRKIEPKKEIELDIQGSEIELDRVILDEIGDPLLHLVRNAIDHGIEDPQTRKSLGKNPKGRILIKVSREKGHVIIEIKDDGKGINCADLIKKAVKKGLISEQEAVNVDNKQILAILSMPGFSTASEISDISGRGVGMDVVKTKIDSLGGRIDFESQLGQGSTFYLTLPLTLAIIKAMLVQVGNEIFAIPLMNIRESVKIAETQIKTISGKEVIQVREDVLSLVRLDKELNVVSTSNPRDLLSVIIVEGRADQMGLVVDKIIGEQDVVVKPLGVMVKKVKGVAGATILGDGRVALILDVINLK